MKKPLIIAVLFTLSLTALWWVFIPSPQSKQALNIKEDLPDSYMVNVTVLKYDQQGTLRQQLHAKRATHHPRHNEIHYEYPLITCFSTQGGDWQLGANEGANREGKEEIDLWENVKLHRQASAVNSEISASTSELKAHTKQQTIESQKAVRIEQPTIVITGVGLQGDLRTGQLRTLAKTQTTFQAPNPDHARLR